MSDDVDRAMKSTRIWLDRLMRAAILPRPSVHYLRFLVKEYEDAERNLAEEEARSRGEYGEQ